MIWMSIAMASPCDEVAPALRAVSVALEDVRTEEAQEGLRAAEDALVGCDRVAEPATLGTFWLLEGVLRFLEGDEESSSQAFASAGRVAPDVWQDRYGPRIKGHWDAAIASPSWPGRIRLEPTLGGNVHWLDGSRAAEEVEAPAGLHLVQVADPEGVVRFGQLVFLAPAQTLALETGVAPAPLPEPEILPDPVRPPRERKPLRPLPIVAAASAAVGAGLIGLGAERYGAMGRAESGSQLNRTWHTALGMGAGGVALLGTAGVAVGIHVTR